VAILRGLEGTDDYRQDALDTLSDDLEKPEVRRLLNTEPYAASVCQNPTLTHERLDSRRT
jgi:hypothetical protein